MEYRVNEVGALIFKPRNDENSQDIGKVLEEVKGLKDIISKLECENKTIKKEIEEIKKGMTI